MVLLWWITLSDGDFFFFRNRLVMGNGYGYGRGVKSKSHSVLSNYRIKVNSCLLPLVGRGKHKNKKTRDQE